MGLQGYVMPEELSSYERKKNWFCLDEENTNPDPTAPKKE